jgi:hypothetical protein
LLQKVYEKYSQPTSDWGGDKGTGHSYIELYEKYMETKQSICLLEIGVQCGYSLKMWEEYFADSDIYGIDIDLSFNKFPELKNLFEFDATKNNLVPDSFRSIEFDYIVDDGSHRVQDQIKSFDIFYPQLKVGGKYFIEDIDGDLSLLTIANHLRKRGISYIIEDVRYIKGRFDDIMIVANK